MLKKEDIEHLAVLARIAVSDEEKEGLVKDLDAVLAYVSEVSSIATESDTIPRVGSLRNVMRKDVDVHPSGGFSKLMLANAPHVEDDYIKVEQIQA